MSTNGEMSIRIGQTIEIMGSLEQGRVPGTWLLDVTAVDGDRVSGRNEHGDTMTFDVRTGAIRMHILGGWLVGEGKAGGTSTTAADDARRIDDRAYWAGVTAANAAARSDVSYRAAVDGAR